MVIIIVIVVVIIIVIIIIVIIVVVIIIVITIVIVIPVINSIFIQNERKAAKARVQRDQERVAKALEAARMAGDKEKEIKGLALQIDALKVCMYIHNLTLY